MKMWLITCGANIVCRSTWTRSDPKLEDPEERARLARVFQRGLNQPVGCVLPLEYQWWQAGPRWRSSAWPVRSERLMLVPGDSPVGLRLPLETLPLAPDADASIRQFPQDPLEPRGPLPRPAELRQSLPGSAAWVTRDAPAVEHFQMQARGPGRSPQTTPSGLQPGEIVRTALCVEPRGGQLHVFLPPLDRCEAFLELVSAIEDTAAALQTPVVIEGYTPPFDPRIDHIKVTPDPGVIEVNVHPSASWQDLVENTTTLYEEARLTRLGTEKFDLDGRHTGTGGGNHVLLGGRTPADSPFLRRPHLLRSLIAYWQNHPSLSYLFSGTFLGPTSQAPRVDEGRRDALYELEIAFQQVPDGADCPPWLVDRIFRHLLVDVTGNTHRAEFCIDKLYSPDSASGRLGLVEFRALEMPPHARMSLTQQLLLRSLVARFWNQPYRASLVPWQTALHDRFMLPHFVWEDFGDVIRETRDAGFPLETAWYLPHWEFRFPKIGEIAHRGLHLELSDEFTRRWDQSQSLLHENGIAFGAYGDPDSTARPWVVDPLPLLIAADQWRAVAAGLAQRARLLDRVLTDLYGPQTLISRRVLPAEVVFRHPGFLRAYHGQRPVGNRFLTCYAADLARSSDGTWWVLADRTEAPSGAGFALENRIVVSRMLPDVFHGCQVERLATYFLALAADVGRIGARSTATTRGSCC
jgi:uncharacterized protein (DUF2126 family)